MTKLTFHLSRYSNIHNFQDCSNTNRHELHEKPLKSAKVTARCAISSLKIMGSYFFQNDKGHAVTIKAGHFIHTIENILTRQLAAYLKVSEETWFQQHGAICQTATITINTEKLCFLVTSSLGMRTLFGLRDCTILQPAISSFDGIQKSRSSVHHPHSIPQNLKRRIQNVAQNPLQALCRAINNVCSILEQCIRTLY